MHHASHKAPQYAQALLLLSEASGRTAAIEKDLKAVADSVADNPELLRFLADDFVKPEGKHETLSEILTGRIDPVVGFFLAMLQVEKCIPIIRDISREYSDLIAAKQHRVSGSLISAVPLPEETVKHIEQETSRILAKDVSLTPSVDDDMLGGVIVRVGNFVIDGSIESELSKARAALSN